MTVSVGVIFQIIGYVVIVIVGGTGNSLVLIYFMRHERHMAKNYRLFIINLAITDLISCFLSPAYLLVSRTGKQIWFGSDTVCKYGSIVVVSIATASLWITCGMSIMRYRSLSDPFNSQQLKRKYVQIYCMCIWVLSFTLSCFKPAKFQERNGRCQLGLTGLDVKFYIMAYLYYLLCAVTPLVAIFLCTWKVGKIIKDSRNFTKNMKRHNNINNEVCKKTESSLNLASILHIAFTLPVIVYSMLLCFLAENFSRILISNNDSIVEVGSWFWLIFVLNSIANCCVYAGRNPRFKEYIKTLSRCNKQNQPPC